MTSVVVIEDLSHAYPSSRKQKQERVALRNFSLTINKGEIFCLLGPNGSGKSTLFKILSTLLRPTSGSAKIFEFDVLQQPDKVRQCIGVVFQHPSLDKKLTVKENLLHQGHLYNLRGTMLEQRIHETLSLVGLLDRSNDLIENLSGGMQRRVELAKSLLHNPPLLLLDEPSTGLDPGARIDFMNYLSELRNINGVTVILTTHILDEAEKGNRLAIMDLGNLVALGSPQELKHEIGGDIISMTSKDPHALSKSIQQRFGEVVQVVDQTVRIERRNGHEHVPQLVEAFPGQIETVILSKPTLEDVFIRKTGHKFLENGD